MHFDFLGIKRWSSWSRDCLSAMSMTTNLTEQCSCNQAFGNWSCSHFLVEEERKYHKKLNWNSRHYSFISHPISLPFWKMPEHIIHGKTSERELPDAVAMTLLFRTRQNFELIQLFVCHSCFNKEHFTVLYQHFQ